MSKFYKVLKDHPYYEEGAILKSGEPDNDGDYFYDSVSEIFVKDIKGISDNPQEFSSVVENCPDWFERVYEHKLVGKVKYVAREQAVKLFKAQYK